MISAVLHASMMSFLRVYLTLKRCQKFAAFPPKIGWGWMVCVRVCVWQSVTYRYREFPVPEIFHFFGGIGTGIGKNWYRKKVSEPVSEKFGTGKSLGTGIGKIWYRKKVPVSVSKIFGIGKKYRYQYRLKFWVPSHTDWYQAPTNHITNNCTSS